MNTNILAYIEIPKGSNVKYEYNKNLNNLEMDRILHGSMYYPQNYGFIPQTLADDGDEIDILVFTEPLIPGCFVKCRIIGYIDMEDEKGKDEKILAVAANDPKFQHVNTIDDIEKYNIDQIEEFFKTYKNLENNKWVKVRNVYNKEEAFKLLQKSKNKYKQAQI